MKLEFNNMNKENDITSKESTAILFVQFPLNYTMVEIGKRTHNYTPAFQLKDLPDT